MSDKTFKLKVPDQLPDGTPEYISQGNYAVAIAAGATVETPSGRFADWLVREYGFEDVTPEDEPEETPANPLEAEYPQDFPGRNVFIRLQIAFETVRDLDKEQLVTLNGIGPSTADAVLEYFAGMAGDGENTGDDAAEGE